MARISHDEKEYMTSNNNTIHDDSTLQMHRYQKQAKNITGRKALAAKYYPSRRLQKRYLLLIFFLLIAVIIVAIQLPALVSANNNLIMVQIGGQQSATIDLRQRVAISSSFYGVNVFPKNGSSSVDEPFSGFMSYTPYLISTMQDMHIELLRYPGGDWGENHILSLDQLSDFSQLLIETKSDGMLQAHLAGPIKDQQGNLQPPGLTPDLNSRALLAAQWVDYMNNIHSP